jgi:hypothetical protein
MGRRTEVNKISTVSPASGFTLWVRYALIVVAFLFVAGGVVQFFLAGYAAFGGAKAAERWQDHADMGEMIGLLTYLLPILALIGRVGVPRIGHAFVVAALFILQTILANVDTDWIAAFHPLNGVLLMGAASSLGGRMIELVRSRQRETPAPAAS